MAKDDPQFNLRIPPGLRKKVAAAAKANNRSVTAEINARLESTFLDEEPTEIVALHDIIDRANLLLKHFRG
ncbi:Arc family DNA-binding protein [Rhizobium leguminosarum]|uniref:Arc family DNA-binding protein n=1 Tax=Rhizobium leguminosarum TaxID=384 RepID=UPI00162274E0|nr:Arc family DNA-binding protein [Rhizobium leguminosarum]